MIDEKYEQLQAIGESAAESIAEMVAALECDYERLAELREELTDAHADDNGDVPNSASPISEWVAYQANHEDRLADLTASAREYLELTAAAGDCENQEDAQRRIEEDALEVLVRSEWYSPGADREPPAEYRILLSTGGPATRIIGELTEHGEPSSARLQAQDWFTPWTDYRGDAISEDDLLTYARFFHFGEG